MDTRTVLKTSYGGSGGGSRQFLLLTRHHARLRTSIQTKRGMIAEAEAEAETEGFRAAPISFMKLPAALESDPQFTRESHVLRCKCTITPPANG